MLNFSRVFFVTFILLFSFFSYAEQGRVAIIIDDIGYRYSDAKALEAAGAQLLVLECIPADLGKAITDALTIPTIGIGAGKDTDGQILVMHDALGIACNYMPKFSRNFLQDTGDIKKAIELYISEVSLGNFPSDEHTFS